MRVKRIVALALLAGLLSTLPAYAQTVTPMIPPSRCPDVPTAPSPPAVSVPHAEMEAAVAGYDAWRVAVIPVLACRQSEAVELSQAAETRTAEFNAANRQAVETGAAWQAAAEARAAASSSNRRRR